MTYSYEYVSRKRQPAFLPSAPEQGRDYGEFLRDLRAQWFPEDSSGSAQQQELWSYIVEIDLGQGLARLANPIKVAVEQQPDGVVIFAPLLGLSGFGPDIQAAGTDLVSTIKDLRREYSADPQRLHESARVLLGKLNAIR